MLLKDIIKSYPHEIFTRNIEEDTAISHITDNSKNVQNGSMFVAIDGVNLKGISFIQDAFLKGAKLCVVKKDDMAIVNLDTKVIFVDNPREFLAYAIFNLYKDFIPNNLITVTGTNGKTSTSSFVSQILNYFNIKNIFIGTLGTYINGKHYNEGLTTPSSINLAEAFKKANEQGANYAVMESSSHGIYQKRVAGLKFKAIGWTNLTQDHLDYHKTMEDYYQAKKAIFLDNKEASLVINVDDEYGRRLKKECEHLGFNIIDYGKNAKNLKIISILYDEKHNQQHVKFLYNNKPYVFGVNLFGEFQVYNIFCAIGLLLSTFSMEQILASIHSIKEVEGRMNLVEECKKGKIFVDFAHTPNALEEVLKVLSKKNPQKLKVLFGCGGNRDALKRPLMGAIAEKYADVLYISDDNPRFEEADKIRAEVVSGITKNTKKEIYNIAGRKNAIFEAVKNLVDGEILLVAGKGAENGQIIKNEIIDFQDKLVILEAIREFHK